MEEWELAEQAQETADLEAELQRDSKILTPPDVIPDADNPFADAIACGVKQTQWGNAVSLSSEFVRVPDGIDRKRIRATAKLIDSPEYAAILGRFSAFRSWVAAMAVPFAPFGNGYYLVRMKRVEEIEKEYERLKKEILPGLEQTLRDNWQQRKEEAVAALPGVISLFDLPSAQQVLNRTVLWLNWLEVDPARMKTRRQVADIRENLSTIENLMASALAEELRGVLDRAVERLTPEADGRKKIFRDSLLGNVRQFLESFEERAILRNEDLDRVVEQLRKLTEGVSPLDLRKNDAVKDFIKEGFERASTALMDCFAPMKGAERKVIRL